MGVKRYLIVVLICIFLMTSDNWAFFHVLVGHLHIFGEMSVQVLCTFFYVVCFLLSCRSSLYILGFPGGLAGRKSTCNVGDIVSSVPGLGQSPGEGKGYPVQCSCLEDSMNGVALSATDHSVSKRQTQLSDFHFTLYILNIYLLSRICPLVHKT